jgi:hypothetical protein
VDTLLLIRIETFCANGFDLRNDDVRMVFGDYTIQFGSVEHIDHLPFIGYLLCGSVIVGIYRDHILTKAFYGDDKFFTQFS